MNYYYNYFLLFPYKIFFLLLIPSRPSAYFPPDPYNALLYAVSLFHCTRSVISFRDFARWLAMLCSRV